MTHDEIVRALRWLAKETEFIFAAENLNGAADLIESLQAQLAESNEQINWDNELVKKLEAQLADARNELCQKCGTYKYAHKGACDGCRWKKGARE